MDDTTSWKDLPIVLIPGTTSWKDLPTSLTIDILSRLPAKTLIRCTSLAKSWYSLITNPNFISTHINRSISYASKKNADHYLLLCPTSPSPVNPCSLICEKTAVTLENFEIPFCTKSKTLKILGSCNGLVCLTDDSPFCFGRDVYLWNPSIRKHKTLGSRFASLLTDWTTTYPVVGFGFHEPTNDYRVVRVVYFADSEYHFLGKVAPKVEVYSLRTNSWKRVKTSVPRTVNSGTVTHVNGAIYWFAAKKVRDPYECVMFFDLNDEAFREVQFPPNYKRGVGHDATLGLSEFKGSLSLCVFCPNKDYGGSMRFSIWVMREKGTAVSWNKQVKVVLREKVGWPCGFTKSGKLLMEAIGRIRGVMPKNMVSCNLKNLQFMDLGDDGPYTVDATFMESLLMLQRGSIRLRHPKYAGHGSF